MLIAGQVLQDRYRLRKQLRFHPAHQTWVAVDCKATKAQEQFVIVKFLVFARGMQWDEWKLFEREVQVLKQLRHPQIPKYLDSFHIKEPEAWLGLIEEYIPGENLQTLISQGHRFSETEIYDLASQTLEILIYLHEQNPPILHRDIKPSNLILTPAHQVFLVDFGTVQNQGAKLGVSFTVVGTYGYTPMEQFGGQAVPASDLYSLGASLLHMLTGTVPVELVQPDLRLQFRDRISLSNSLATWLEKMTAPALADRFESARTALRALLPLASSPAPALATSDLALLRLQVDAESEQLHIRIRPTWSTPVPRLQDLAGMVLLTLLGPLAIGILALLPFGLVYTRQALSSGDLGAVSIGLLLLCLGGTSWGIGLNWLKQNLTSTLIEAWEHRLIVKYQLLDWTYWQHAQPTSDIADIYVVPVSAEENTMMIRFQATPPLKLANKLNSQDCRALTHILRHWLDCCG